MYLFFNNHFYKQDEPVVFAESKAFRYGELVFETIRCQNGKLFFFQEHFERLIKAATLLHIQLPKHFTATVLRNAVEQLLAKNSLITSRIRVTLFKGKGGLFEDENKVFNLLIESYRINNPHYELNENGLDICFFEMVKKTKDIYSNYKTGNHLIYNLAAQFSKRKKCNEALLFNIDNVVCDSTISNVFIIKDECIFTPPLSDGCIDGIFRNFLIKNTDSIIEQTLTEDDVLNADEIFLTNAVRGIQWVKSLEGNFYTNQLTVSIFNTLAATLNEQ